MGNHPAALVGTKGEMTRQIEADLPMVQAKKKHTAKAAFFAGEIVEVKGLAFRVERIGRRTLVLRPSGW